jgi:hypothetical protein
MPHEPSHEELLAELKPLLSEGEQVLVTATQNLINAPLKRDTAVVTTRRFLIFRPKMFGRMNLDDYLWQDVDDVTVEANVLGSTIKVKGSKRTKTGGEVPFERTVDGLDKAQALELYARAQEMEEQWREKNRARLIEEDRARAGGVYVQTPSPSEKQGQQSIEERLAKLKSLADQGLITTAEYEARKAQIVAEL